MSLSSAETYAARARDAADAHTVGDNMYRAISELIQEIKQLQVKVSNLEARLRR